MDEPRADLLDRLALRAVGRPPASARPRGWRIGISRRQAIGGGARAAAALTLMGSLRLSLAGPAAAQRQSCIPCLEQAYKKAQQSFRRCAKLRDEIGRLNEAREQVADLIDRLFKRYQRRRTKKNKRALESARALIIDIHARSAEVSEALNGCYEDTDYQLKMDRYKCVGLPSTAQAGGRQGCNEEGGPAGSTGGPPGAGGTGQVHDPCGCVGSDICCNCIHTDPPGFICCIAPYACQCCPGG